MNIIDFFMPEDFKYTLHCAALGARTCWNAGGLDDLLIDKRVTDPVQRAKFLQKLAKSKHFSVFGHVFTYKEIGEEAARELAATRLKTQYDLKEPGVLGISMRHYLEEFLSKHPEQIDDFFNGIATFDTPIEVLGRKENVALVGLVREHGGYAAFHIDDVSRTMTHQLVRHTASNYSQRSQRYVSEQSNHAIIPPSIAENPQTRGMFNDIVYHAYKAYNALLGSGVKKEDARFLLPHGASTAIMVSGPFNRIQDLIQKRDHKGVQWEIKDTTQKMKYLLENNLAR